MIVAGSGGIVGTPEFTTQGGSQRSVPLATAQLFGRIALSLDGVDIVHIADQCRIGDITESVGAGGRLGRETVGKDGLIGLVGTLATETVSKDSRLSITLDALVLTVA